MLVSTSGPLPDVVGREGRREKLWEDEDGDEKNTSGTISGFTDDLVNDRTDNVDPKKAGPDSSTAVGGITMERTNVCFCIIWRLLLPISYGGWQTAF